MQSSKMGPRAGTRTIPLIRREQSVTDEYGAYNRSKQGAVIRQLDFPLKSERYNPLQQQEINFVENYIPVKRVHGFED